MMTAPSCSHIWECFLWLLGASAASFLLHLLRSYCVEQNNHNCALRIVTLSNKAIPVHIAEGWVLRYNAQELLFLVSVINLAAARKSRYRCDTSELDGILQSCGRGTNFVGTVLHGVMGGAAADRLLSVVEALMFVSGRERYLLPYDIVDFTIESALSSGQDSGEAGFPALCIVNQLSKDLLMLGFLRKVREKPDACYIPTTLVQFRQLRGGGWHRRFLDEMRILHTSFASQHLVRLLIECRRYQDALEVMQCDSFCAKRVKDMKEPEAAEQHVMDCVLLLECPEASLNPPTTAIENACHQMAQHVKEGRSVLALGLFLSQQRRAAGKKLLLAALELSQTCLATESLLLSKLFKRLATISLCFKHEKVYEEYLQTSRDLCGANIKDLHILLLDAVTMHFKSSIIQEHTEPKIQCQVNRINERLLQLAHDSLLVIDAVMIEFRHDATIVRTLINMILQKKSTDLATASITPSLRWGTLFHSLSLQFSKKSPKYLGNLPSATANYSQTIVTIKGAQMSHIS